MKKSIRFILKIVCPVVCFLFLILCFFVLIPLTEKGIPVNKEISVKGSECWMKKLNGNLYLNEITIPGSHDAGTKYVTLPFFSKCQGEGIYEQLLNGYRYLDIRLGVDKAKGKKNLVVMHGFTHCRKSFNPFSKDLTLDDIVSDCHDFLLENPDETILFVVKQEHGSEPVEEFEMLFDELIRPYKKYFLLTDSIPTLNEARGKIVLFRRYNDEAGLGKSSGIGFDWKSQKGHSDTSLASEINENMNCVSYVQDRYEYNVREKWAAFTKDIGRIPSTRGTGICFVNFLSTKGKKTYGHPYKYARRLNKMLYEEEPEGFMGWVIVDFGSRDLAEKIYKRNF